MTDLHKEEYQTIRTEVETAMSELNALESGALLVAASVFAWLMTHNSHDMIAFGWFIPLALVMLCIIRAVSLNRHLGALGEYLKLYEDKFIQPELCGWEHFLDDPGKRESTTRRESRGKTRLIFWGCLLAFTIVAGAVGYFSDPTTLAATKPDLASVSVLINARP